MPFANVTVTSGVPRPGLAAGTVGTARARSQGPEEWESETWLQRPTGTLALETFPGSVGASRSGAAGLAQGCRGLKQVAAPGGRGPGTESRGPVCVGACSKEPAWAQPPRC